MPADSGLRVPGWNFQHTTPKPVPWKDYKSQLKRSREQSIVVLELWSLQSGSPRGRRFVWWLVDRHAGMLRKLLNGLLKRKPAIGAVHSLLCLVSDAMRVSDVVEERGPAAGRVVAGSVRLSRTPRAAKR